MARMLPPCFRAARDGRLAAEQRVFDVLAAQLDDDWCVVHGVPLVLPGQREAEADFLLAHPAHGLLVVEVKGGLLEVRDGTWVQTSRSGRRRRLAKSPYEQASRARHLLVDYLERRRLPWRGWRIGHVVVLPGCVVPGDPWGPDRPREITLDATDLADAPRALVRAAGFWAADGRVAPSREEIEQLLGALGVNRSLRAPLSVQIRNDTELLRLTGRQAWVLDHLQELPRVHVEGCAGSGKTVMATWEAARRHRAGQRVGILCYNRLLGERIAETEGMPPLAGAFLELCLDALHGGGMDRATVDWDRLPAEAAPALRERYGLLDALLVDEGQDLDAGSWEVVEGLLDPRGPRVLHVFTDAEQAIHRPTAVPRALGLSPLRLRDNHRTPGCIGELLAGLSGREVRFHRAAEGRVRTVARDGRPLPARLADVVGALVHGDGARPEDLVILTPGAAERSALTDGLDLSGVRVARDRTPGSGEVLATSVHKFKGLESPVVIACELDRGPDGTLGRRLRYVAYSRATTALVVLE